MPWVDCPEDYDAPKGERIRNIFRCEVPWWLEWTPDQIMDWLVSAVADLAEVINNAILQEFGVTLVDIDIQVEVVEPGKVYRIVVYYTSPGIPVWAVAAIILSLLALVLYLMPPALEAVQRLVEVVPGWVWPVVGVGVLIGVGGIISAVRRRR